MLLLMSLHFLPTSTITLIYNWTGDIELCCCKKKWGIISQKRRMAVFRSQGLKDVTPSALVRCPVWKWKPVANWRVTVRACTRWWSPAARLLIGPSKPIKAHCFCLFRLQREYWSVRKTTQANAANCQRVLGSDNSVYFPNLPKKQKSPPT